MKVLIAGFGYVGQELGAQLLRQNVQVWGVRRSAVDLDVAVANLQVLSLDLTEEASMHELPSEVDQVALLVSPDARTDEAYRRAYPDLTANLAKKYPLARLLLVSSTSVYDQDGGSVVTDDSPATAPEFAATRIREAESVVHAHETPSVVVRASGIYGPGRTRTLASLATSPSPLVDGVALTNRIHQQDLARILGFLMVRPQITGTILATDPTPSSLDEMRSWVLTSPLAAAWLASLEHAPALAPTRTRRSRRMLPARLLELGFAFTYPSFREGYGEILRSASVS